MKGTRVLQKVHKNLTDGTRTLRKVHESYKRYIFIANMYLS